jgi:hypothetical protein
MAKINYAFGRQIWDAGLGAKRDVWPATLAFCNDAMRPKLTSQMRKLLMPMS